MVQKGMIILGIETSCDETAASLVSEEKKILSNVVSSQFKDHKPFGGVVPEIAARAHIEQIIPTIAEALRSARVSLAEIDGIAVTAGPGLLTSLMVGVDTAKTLAMVLHKPIVAVNHMEAHAYSTLIEIPPKKTKLLFPALALTVSGGHTELLLISGWLKHKKIGQTLDDAAGECFDKVAKLLSLPYPGGPALARLAERGRATIAFPRPMISSGNFNFSFSGLKTAVLYYLRSEGSKIKNKRFRARVAASVQEAIVDVLVAKTIAAALKHRVKNILLGGGVAANHLLRQKLKAESYKLKSNFLAAQPEYCTDNAAMIAYAGWLHMQRGDYTPIKKVRANADWEL